LYQKLITVLVGENCYYTPGRGKIVSRKIITLLVGGKLCRVI